MTVDLTIKRDCMYVAMSVIRSANCLCTRLCAGQIGSCVSKYLAKLNGKNLKKFTLKHNSEMEKREE